jgi:hypothetical protein
VNRLLTFLEVAFYMVASIFPAGLCAARPQFIWQWLTFELLAYETFFPFEIYWCVRAECAFVLPRFNKLLVGGM